MKLSAVVVTRNEEKNIARCLKSLSFADEIIIVDSRSMDKTIPLAKKFTKKVYFRDFDGFSAVKNAGIEKAKGEWILCVDADEEITPELREKIKETISSGSARDGYFIKRLTWFLGKIIRHSGWGTRDYQLRLFRKKAGRFEGKIHEAVRVKGETGRIEEPMYHYSYPDSGTYISKMNRYTSMQAMEKKSAPALKMIFNPFITFFSMFFLKGGFLDGIRGFILAVYSGFSEFTRFAKMTEHLGPHPQPKPKPHAVIEGEDEEKGLIVRMPNWVGDCIMATAFLPALKKTHGRICLVVKKGTEDVFRGNPHTDSVIVYDRKKASGFFSAMSAIKKTGIKRAVSLSPSFSSHMMLLLAGIKERFGYSDDLGNALLARAYKRDKTHKSEHVLGEYAKVLSLAGGSFDVKKLRQEIHIDRGEEKDFLGKSKIQNLKSKIVLAPFAGFGPSKTWPFEYYEEVAEALIKKSKKNSVFITGGSHEGTAGIRQSLLRSKQFHDLRGIPLRQAFILIKNAKLFIGNDSGLMHAADALGVSMVVIFGSTAPSWGGPVSKKAKVVYKELECQPCFSKVCKFGHYRCLKEVGVGEVLKKNY